MSARTEWKGTASSLLVALGEAVDERIAKSKTWPDNPRALSGRLRRAATFLRKIGIEVGFKRKGSRGLGSFTSLHPRQKMRVRNRPHSPHSPRPRQMRTNVIDFAANGPRTVTGNENGSDVPTVRANRLGTNPGSAADGADAKSPPQSAAGGAGSTGWRGRI